MRSVLSKLTSHLAICRSRVLKASVGIHHMTRAELDESLIWRARTSGLVDKIQHVAHVPHLR